MSVSCPKCGSRFLNHSRARNFNERIDALFGVRPLRCADCRVRFVARTFRLQDTLFAKCPRCYRMDLNLWYSEHMRATAYMALLLLLGGMRHRCEYCRLNFVSLRRRKESFSFHRWERYKNRENGQPK